MEEELASTAQTVEAASQRIQEMLDKSREDDTGVKLEVNEQLLDSCTELMKAIQVLIASSKDLQVEIVEEGMVSEKEDIEMGKERCQGMENTPRIMTIITASVCASVVLYSIILSISFITFLLS